MCFDIRLALALCLGVSVSTALPLSGQDTETPPAETTTAEPSAQVEDPVAPEDTPETKFTTMYLRWEEMQAEAKAKEEAFRNAPQSDKEVLRAAYNDLVTQMQALLPELTQAAMDAYRLSETPDPKMSKLLLGMMINDAVFSRDREALEIAQLLTEKGCPKELLEKARQARRLGPFSKEVIDEAIRRYDEYQANDLPRVTIVTSKGEIELELFENEAPNTVANFISLIDSGFYKGLAFHRVIEDFVAQGGDPNGNGEGGPGYTIACESYTPDHRNHFPGVISMAHAGRDTGGSQFYITLNTYSRLEHASLDGKHTVFGRVIRGQEVLNLLQRRTPGDAEPAAPDTITDITVTRRREHPYEPVVTKDPESPDTGNGTEGGGGNGAGEGGETGAAGGVDK